MIRTLIGLLGFGLAAATPAAAQSQIQPIVVRPAKEHPNCQIYLKANGSRLLYKGKPISAGGACPSDYLPGTVTRFGADTYRLQVSGADCIITPAGMGQCR
jgi:hypothetical protein